ncbi:unnamed protein product [Periconia digitata]|uniref:Protein SQS1 n=1 Tax=Periconia digitata TaxID=1303443 RepID=A0A9W4UP87_9PLEO|nr:unnamed protein product [Periconia digitata]
MARKKGKNGKPKAKGGAAKSVPRQSQPKRASQFYGDAQQNSGPPTRFSLRDEARWTSNHRTTAFDSSKKLRNMPIAFVSAGFLEGTLEKKSVPPLESKDRPVSPPDVNTQEMADMTIHSSSPSPSVASSSGASSEEVVVFKGRAQPQSAPSIEQSADAPSDNTRPTNEHAKSTVTSLTVAMASSAVKSGPESDAVSKQRRDGKPAWEVQAPAEWVSRSKPRIGWLPSRDRPNMEAFLRGEVDPRTMHHDVQNIWENEEVLNIASTFANRPLDLDGGTDSEWGLSPDQSESQDEEDDMDGWDSDQLRDLDDMSTSTDMEGKVIRILNKRTRKSGPQYLVVYEGSVADDARWLPATFLTDVADQELVRKFEAKLAARPAPESSTSEDDSELDELDDEDNDEEEEEDDDDDDDESLDDETLARVLQKQEELGLGSEELLLHAADEYFKDDWGSISGMDSISFSRPNKRRQFRAGGGRRAEPHFPSASAMADALSQDAYGGFDVMDFERPSLRPLKKGRRNKLPPELEDTEFTEQFREQWDADRAKKRLKKAEREELRKQGLLGRKGKAPDLSVKYSNGADFVDITEEIRSFMASDKQSLSLPPMDSRRRAVIHQLVDYIGLSSKSRGAGANRFTVLAKTRRSVAFDDDAFDALIDQKRFRSRWGRVDTTPRGPKQAKGKGASGRAGRPNVGYKDGDVVGASAPELGPENRGRALLEKMGWSKGMALGAHENKGILQPIAHVVKTNRAGLQ